jgi:hypothetical protein
MHISLLRKEQRATNGTNADADYADADAEQKQKELGSLLDPLGLSRPTPKPKPSSWLSWLMGDCWRLAARSNSSWGGALVGAGSWVAAGGEW